MNTYRVEIEKDYHDDRIRWLKVSHNGGAAWSLIEIRSSLESEQIVNALQQSFAVDGAKSTAHEHNFSQGLHCSVCGEALF